ncbi:MAG: nucleoside deaminase [Terriglobales bacterium]
MRTALAAARAGIAAGQSPFGCTIVQGGELIASAHNQVWAAGDPTAHAEIEAIRTAARKLGAIALSGCVLYTTCEPCPMCMAAIHWARIERVVFGASIADAAAAGFHELHLPARELLQRGGSKVMLTGGCLAAACRSLFDEWKSAGRSPAY